MNSTDKEIGLVLSGGGVRGVAHAGLLQAFEEFQVKPSRIAGSSAGAMVGALYASGSSPDKIRTFFREHSNIFRLSNVSINSKPGILDVEKYAELFKPYLDEHTFETLSIPIYICVTDVLQGEFRFFSEGELVRPVLASAAIPGVFTPVEIDGGWYIDGGTMNNFPVEPLMGRTDILLGSFVSTKKALTKKDLTNTLQLVNRANELNILSGAICRFRHCDFMFVPPELANYRMFDTKKTDEIYEIGYRYAREQLEKLSGENGIEWQRKRDV